MYYVYILHSTVKDRYYIGSTGNIEKRLAQHNAGRTRSTKFGRPWSMIHVEIFPSKTFALRRENEIKRYKSGRAFKKLIQK